MSELNKKIWGEKKEDREPLKEDTPEPEVCEGEMVAKKPSKALLTLEDRKIIREMLYQEVSYSQIGFRLGRHYSSISAEVKKNGGVYKYDPVKAQELAESERNKKIQFINEKRSFREIEINKMKDRIYCLEMQLEILINQVRKITDDKKD